MTLEAFKNKLAEDKALKAAMLEAVKAGKEQEFLAEQGVEVPEIAELSDEDLSGVAGGVKHEMRTTVWKTDSRGNATHWYYVRDQKKFLQYFTCPKCGRVLHQSGELLWCDPCDEWYTGSWFSGAVEHIEPFNG